MGQWQGVRCGAYDALAVLLVVLPRALVRIADRVLFGAVPVALPARPVALVERVY